MVFDEIMRLYNTLERDGKDGEMRKEFLTLNGGDGWTVRSEEHTSELQSLTNLVCRLLLEKKKQKNKNVKPQI